MQPIQNKSIAKHLYYLEKFGFFLKTQRQTIFKEDQQSFADRVSVFSSIPINSSIIDQMESGDPMAPFFGWLAVWNMFQIGDSILDISKAESAMFLSSIQHDANIEDEIFKYLNPPSQPSEPTS